MGNVWATNGLGADGDNRITAVHTSTDGITWTKEAAYDYYAHGPLAMCKLGNNGDIEQCSYVYTLQGWIKSVKGQNFSYALGYHDKDYKGIAATAYGGDKVGLKETPIAQHTVNGQLVIDNLYNGNIATWTTNTPALTVKGVADMTNQYTYDQLNRIKSSSVLGKADAYKTGYSYDANGNILALQRYNGTGQMFDQFSYNYENKGAGYLQNTNKLRSVDDAIKGPLSPTLNAEDLSADDLEDQNIDNYSYDDIGNLNKDAQEEIARIEWTVYGKVKAVYRIAGSNKPNLVFEYDASGNRVTKTSIKGTDIQKTFYIRDASGNVMGTYTSTGTSSLIALKEQYLYGSSRLGMLEKGARSYELIDHLGNVRAVVNEFKEVEAAYEYYAFGMSLAKVEGGYRYGFNGKEADKETSWYDYGERFYSDKIGRFFSVDRYVNKYTSFSPYHRTANNPIIFIESNGEDFIIFIETNINGKTKVATCHSDQYAVMSKTTTTMSYVVVKHPGPDRFFYQTTNKTNTYAPTKNCISCLESSEVDYKEKEFFPIMNGKINDRYSSGITKTSFWPFSFYDTDYMSLAKLAPDELKAELVQRDFSKYRMLKHLKTEHDITIVGLTVYSLSMTAIELSPTIVGIINSAKKLKFSDLAKTGKIDPKEIRFSQNSISPKFKDGSSVTDLAEGLKKGTIKADDIPAIRVVEKDGLIFTLDNRRLKAFQEAGVPINYEKLESIPNNQLFKFSTTNQGVSIEVR